MYSHKLLSKGGCHSIPLCSYNTGTITASGIPANIRLPLHVLDILVMFVFNPLASSAAQRLECTHVNNKYTTVSVLYLLFSFSIHIMYAYIEK